MIIEISFTDNILLICLKNNEREEVRIKSGLPEDYEYDFSYENLYSIYLNLEKLDATIKNSMKNNDKYLWKINFSKYPKITANFKSLIPKIIRKKYIENELMDFQVTGVNWLLKENNRILADDMGLGKSLQTIYCLEKLIFTKKISSILIFCSKTLTTNWSNELIKWSPLLHTKEIRTSDINITINKFFPKFNILIIPYSLMTNVINSLDVKEYNFDVIIADEAHKLRNSSSALHKSFIKLNKIRTWFLTGTPLERDSKDIQNLLLCLNKRKFFINKNISDTILKSRLELNSLRRLKVNVLKNLPKVHHHIEELEMEKKQLENYNQLLKEMKLSKGVDKIGFLSKLSIAAIYHQDKTSNKFIKAIEIASKYKKLCKKLIIFCDFNEPLRLLQNKLREKKILSHLLYGEKDMIERYRILNDYKNNNLITILLCNSKIGREGLTLTEASSMIFLNEWWNPSSNRQAEDRINRIGQKEEMNIHLLRSKNTIDIHVAKILENKNYIEKDFLDRLIKNIN